MTIHERAFDVSGVVQRAYSVLEVKSVRPDERVIRGIATTPTPDRAGDIVEPLGIKFNNPLPLLWQHNSKEPVGLATFGKPSKSGIEFEASIPEVTEPGTLKDRTDEAWQSIKHGLVRGVSIGFRSIEMSFIDKGGIHFIESEVLELSLVTIPANAEANIQTIKSFDLAPLPDVGTKAAASEPQPSRSLGKRNSSISLAPKDANPVKTYSEQIAALEHKRAANVAALEAVQAKCRDEDRTKNDAEREEFDNLSVEIEGVDRELIDLRKLETINRAKAQIIESVTTPAAATEKRVPYGAIQVKANVEPWRAFVRYVQAKGRAHYTGRSAFEIAKSEPEWENTPEVALALSADIEMLMRQKAAVPVGTTTGADWAAPLIAYTQFVQAFAELLRPLTIIGRIPGITMVPFNIQIPRETASASVGWVGEDAPKPVSKGAFDSITMRWAKAAGIAVLTEELVRFSNPAAENVVRNQLTRAMTQFLDRQFVDPTVAAVANVSPASITNGVAAQTASGTTAAAWRSDAKAMLQTIAAQNQSLAGGVWIMTQQQAISFGLMLNALGNNFYPGIDASGGTLLGYPVIASENIPATGGSPSDGYPIIFAIAPEILLADDGQTVVDVSREASVQMDSTPDSPPLGTTTLVSFWQMNYVGIRAERWINWAKRRATAVAYIQNAKYFE